MTKLQENNGDASADTSTGYTVSLGDVFQGTLDTVEDRDWLRIELTAGTIYDIRLKVDSAPVDTNTDLRSFGIALYNLEGNHVANGALVPSGADLIIDPAFSGSYFIQVYSPPEDSSGTYELSVTENTIPIGSSNDIANYLTDGYREWKGIGRVAFDIASGSVLTADITALPDAAQQTARWAFEAWTNVTGIRFELVNADNADITFVIVEDGGPRARYSSSNGVIVSAQVLIPENMLAQTETGINRIATYIHEIGHALGLGHPGPYPKDVDSPNAYYGDDNLFLIDSRQASIMSYFSQDNNTYINASRATPVTPMIADIIAIQNLYGPPTHINAGDTVYGYQSNVDGYLGEFFTLWSGEHNPFFSIEAGMFSHPELADLDGDGDLDLIVGTYPINPDGSLDYGRIDYYENTGTLTRPAFTQRTGEANPLAGTEAARSSRFALADMDNDSDLDIMVGFSYYYENTGTLTSPVFTRRTGTANPLTDIEIDGISRYTFADLDGDGDPDMIIVDEDGNTRYVENTGTAANPAFTQRTGEANPLAGITAEDSRQPAFTDIDSDGDLDLVMGARNGVIHYYENTGSATRPVFTQHTGETNPLAHINRLYTNAPALADVDGDGDPDLISGHQDGRLYYFQNTGTATRPDFVATGLTRPFAITLYDNGGIDTLDLSTDPADQRVDLRPEGISDVYGLIGNLVIARNTLIERYVAGSGKDQVTGNIADNWLEGRLGDDTLLGGPGDDLLIGGPGGDILDGGPGTDTASYQDSNERVDVRLSGTYVRYGYADGDTLTAIENLIGSNYNDTLAGHGQNNILTGNAGNDLLWGSAGNDTLEGGPGADRLVGGSGNDTASYVSSDAGVTVQLHDFTTAGGHAEGDTFPYKVDVTWTDGDGVAQTESLPDIENLSGSAFDDTLAGDRRENALLGLDGNDYLDGRAGADALVGGAGSDTASYAASDTGVIVRLHNLSARDGHAAGDTFPQRVTVSWTDNNGIVQTDSLPDIENLTGSGHADVLAGDRRDNVIDGGPGNDVLYGGPGGGDDVLRGGTGDDALYGGQGSDRLIGGPGDDRLIGGPGKDSFVFERDNDNDAILDFSLGDDHIDLTAFETDEDYRPTLTQQTEGVLLDLNEIDGGTVLLVDLMILPGPDDFIV